MIWLAVATSQSWPPRKAHPLRPVGLLTCTDFVFNHPDGGVVASLIDKRDRSKLLDSIEGVIEQGRRLGVRSFISGSGNTGNSWDQSVTESGGGVE